MALSNEKIKCKLIPYASSLYQETLALREKILRVPLGLTLTEDDIAHDALSYHFVALINKNIIGCGILEPVTATKAKVRQMAIAPLYQKHGIGKRLLLYIEKSAKHMGIEVIELDARKSAKEFYSKMGYQEYGKIFIKKNIEHIKMRKILQNTK